MGLQTKKPITPSQRHLIKLDKKHLRKKPLLKKNLKGLKNSSGRNAYGIITIHHKGTGHKKKYRNVDFVINQKIFTGLVCSIEYDPNRKASIAAVFQLNTNKFFYTLAPKNLKIGDIVKSGPNNEPKIGHSLPLSEIPIGSFIFNISTNNKNHAQFTRAAGTFSILKEKTMTSAKIKLSSGKILTISTKCYASIGVVSNELFFLSQLGKAGHSRWLNNRPSVRGVAMNPVDHPHGGGEGKKSGKKKNPWGKHITKTVKNGKK